MYPKGIRKKITQGGKFMKTIDLGSILDDSDLIIEYSDDHDNGQKNTNQIVRTGLLSLQKGNKENNLIHKTRKKKHKKKHADIKNLTANYNAYDNTTPKPYPSKKIAFNFKEYIGKELYISDKDGLTASIHGSNDDKNIFISNVVPFVTKQIYEHKDNGEILSTLEIGIYGKDMPALRMITSNLSNSRYMANHLPHGVIIKDFYRFSTFIKYMSEHATLYHIYDHIGFTENNHEKAFYVHSGGVISSKKSRKTRSELDGGNLTLLNCNIDTNTIVSCLDTIFELEPVTTIMLAFNLLSLCKSQYQQERPEFVFLLYGTSGTFKTSISVYIFNIFKEYYSSPPVNIKVATEASLHRLMRQFRDCVLLIDDAAPSVSGNEVTYKKCENIVRAVGDDTGRIVAGRNNKVNIYKPSGLIALTGEFVPLRDTSSISRCIIYKLEKGSINPKKLYKLQKNKDIYVQCVIDYISWICDNLDEYIAEITDLHVNYRKNLQKNLSKIHSRFPDNVSWLYAVFDMFCKFLIDIYSVPKNMIKQWKKIFKTAINRTIKENKLYLKQQNDAKLFIETLQNLINQKQVDLVPIIIKEKNKKSAIENPTTIGYYDDTYVYLKPEIAYASTSKWLSNNIQSGYSLPLQALLNSLKEQNMIIPDSDGRPKSRLCLSGTRIRVIKLKKEKYFANI